MPSTAHAASTVKAKKWYSGTVNGEKIKKFRFESPQDGFLIVETKYYRCIPVFKSGNGATEEGPVTMGSGIETDENGKTIIVDEYNPDSYKKYNLMHKREKFILSFSAIKGYKGTYKFRMTFIKGVINDDASIDNKKKNASSLLKKKLFIGEIDSADKDWYVFRAPQRGKYIITSKVLNKKEEENPDKFVNYTVYKGSKRKGSGRYTGKKELFSGKLKKGEKIYVKLTGFYSDTYYQIKAKSN